MEPLLAVPSLVRGLQPNGRKDDVDGRVAHDQPLVLRFRKHDEPSTFKPQAAMELSAASLESIQSAWICHCLELACTLDMIQHNHVLPTPLQESS